MSHEGVNRTVFMYGFVTGYARKAMNIQDITHHKDRKVIEHRIKVLNFFDRYGPEATKEAFSVSRSTVFLWKRKLKDGNGQLVALAPASRAPNTRRRRYTPDTVTGYIIKERELHPRLGKAKLREGLKPVCAQAGLTCPSVSTVGRVLSDLKAQGRLPKHVRLTNYGRTRRQLEYKHKSRIKKDRRGDYYPGKPGDLVQLDCVIKFINGIRRYVISAIDYNSEFAFSLAYSSLSSARSKDFLDKFIQVAPFEVKRVQTDNGSEFYKLFHESCEDRSLIHYWNYPRSPRMNAKIERYNRTIQEEFIDYHLDDMADDLGSFNYQLMDWLIWYNTVRPHWTLKLAPPLKAILDRLQLEERQSNMLWTNT
ncbi:MAG TPA: integrase core domain-containing protein [Candidatus Saccharimonadales bacterium]|nr:integrase core domain-containing protein [Candidatus Saccharimonadales bacterium]